MNVDHPAFDVRWEDGVVEFMFGAEDYEPELADLQDAICRADEIKVVAHEGEEHPPYQAHIFLCPGGDCRVWAGVMNRPDRSPTLDEITAALVEWRARRGQRPPVFRVEWAS